MTIGPAVQRAMLGEMHTWDVALTVAGDANGRPSPMILIYVAVPSSVNIGQFVHTVGMAMPNATVAQLEQVATDLVGKTLAYRDGEARAARNGLILPGQDGAS